MYGTERPSWVAAAEVVHKALTKHPFVEIHRSAMQRHVILDAFIEYLLFFSFRDFDRLILLLLSNPDSFVSHDSNVPYDV